MPSLFTVTHDPLSAFLASFLATLCGFPLLLTLGTAAAFGPLIWACALLGAWCATVPLYAVGRFLHGRGRPLPARWQHLADDPRSTAVMAALLPSFTLYWVLMPLLGRSYLQTLQGTAVVTAPLAAVLMVSTLTGTALGVPGVLVSLTSLTLFLTWQHFQRRRPT